MHANFQQPSENADEGEGGSEEFDEPVENPSDVEMVESEKVSEHDMKKMLAKFLLNLETNHKMSIQGVNDVCSLMDTLFSLAKDVLVDKILSNPHMGCLREHILAAVSDESLGGSLSAGLQTRATRLSFTQSNFKLVRPQKVFLRESRKPVRANSQRNRVRAQLETRKKLTGCFIPFKEQLQALLRLPEIAKFVTQNHSSQTDIMEDVCDGTYLQKHKLFKSEKIFLQIVLSYDDLELQNPLRSNTTHKLGMFYFTLLNIPPQYRSQLHNIFLVGIARAKNLKGVGLGRLLADFLGQLKLLRTEGIDMEIGTETKRVWGDLIFVTCDNPAAAFIGGFKESTAAIRCCRTCNLTKNEFAEKFTGFKIRTQKEYHDQCGQLDKAQAQPGPNRVVTRQRLTKDFGINRKSVLCRIGFPVAENLIQDPMHILLEGVCAQEMALFLSHIEAEGVCTLKWVNEELEKFPYESVHDLRNKPNAIESKHLKNLFVKQKASSILTLSYILPLILGEVCEVDEWYRNFLACMKITWAAFTPYAVKDTAKYLTELTVEYCQKFVQLHPGVSFKPKMHFMLHLPRQIERFGPLRLQNTIRYEGKHGWFKNFRWRNFVNLPLSLSEKHQMMLTNETTDNMGNPSKDFVHKGNVIGKGENVNVSRLDPLVCIAIPDSFNAEESFFATNEVTIERVKYSLGQAVLLEDAIPPAFPRFGSIRGLLCSADDRWLLVLDVLETQTFCEEKHAYRVEKNETVAVFEIKTLKNRWTLPIYKVCEENFITNRYTVYPLPYTT